MLTPVGMHVMIMMMVVIMQMLVVIMVMMVRRFIVMVGSVVMMPAIMGVFIVMFIGARVNLLQRVCRRLRARLDDLALNPFAMAAPARIAMA